MRFAELRGTAVGPKFTAPSQITDRSGNSCRAVTAMRVDYCGGEDGKCRYYHSVRNVVYSYSHVN